MRVSVVMIRKKMDAIWKDKLKWGANMLKRKVTRS